MHFSHLSVVLYEPNITRFVILLNKIALNYKNSHGQLATWTSSSCNRAVKPISSSIDYFQKQVKFNCSSRPVQKRRNLNNRILSVHSIFKAASTSCISRCTTADLRKLTKTGLSSFPTVRGVAHVKHTFIVQCTHTKMGGNKKKQKTKTGLHNKTHNRQQKYPAK